MFILTQLELEALLNSIVISFFVGLLTVSISSIFVYFFTFYKVRGKRILSALLYIPLFIPPYLIAFSWMHLIQFSGDRLLFGLTWESISFLRTIPSVIILLTLSLLPIPFFLLSQAVRLIPGYLLDGARLYAKDATVMRKIIFGMILPSILISFLLTFIVTFITFDVPAFLNIQVFLMEIFYLYTFSIQWQRGILLSVIPVAFTGLIWSLILFIYMKGRTFFTTRTFTDSLYCEKKLSLPGNILLVCFVLFLLFLTLFPIVFLHVRGAFFENIIYDTQSSWDALGNTFMIGIAGSTLLTLFSFILFRVWYRYSLGRLLILSFAIFPPITFGIVFIQLLNKPYFQFIYATPFILIVAYCFRFAPILCEVIFANTRHINQELIDAAKLAPHSRMHMVKKIILPLYKPTLFLVWVFGFWFIVTELPITLLVQPAGFQTVMSRLFILLHYGAVEKMSELTLTLLFVSLLPIIALKWYFRSEKKYE